MKRSTRVFVPKSVVKDADGARLLRSGKQFSSESGEGKQNRDVDEWLGRLASVDPADVPCYKGNSSDKVGPTQDIDVTDFNVRESANNKPETDDSKYKMYGIVYGRKRSRLLFSRFDSSSQSEDGVLRDRMYGIQFVRKKQRTRATGHSLTEILNRERISEVLKERQKLVEKPALQIGVRRAILVVESSCNSAVRFSCFLVSVLNFMRRRSRIKLSGLTAFMCSEPIASVFSKHGVHVLPDLSCRKNDILQSGICQIFGSRQFVPLFSLEFSAIPFLFMSLYFSILFRSLYLPGVLVRYLMDLLTKAHGVTGNKKCLSCIPNEMGFSESGTTVSASSSVKKRKVNFFVKDTELAGRSASTRHSANFWNIRKRARSSMRSMRRRNLSSMVLSRGSLHSNTNSLSKINRTGNKVHGANLFGVGNGCTSLSTMRSNHKQRKPVQKSPWINVKELKSTLVELKQNIDSVCCNANILVIGSDRCYREEGAKVMFECLASKDWYLVVKRGGLTRYVHKALHEMRPTASNRFNHAMIWTGENGWKLEFLNKQDWLLFKELHRECIDRNYKVSSSRTILVPGVQEVPGYGDGRCVPFVRPDVYITVNDDEVARAIARKTANYDLDLSDEEWLEKINSGLCDRDDGALKLSAEKFEEMMDQLEKSAYCRPDDVSDESRASSICSDIGRSDIFSAVYQYWRNKREQKCGTLLSVFQFPPRKKSKLVQESIPCKKKSLKKRTSQSRRGKHRSYLQVEQEQDAMPTTRVHEAIRFADRSMESAVLKRKRAQILMDNADLATYKAVMAQKIAEASQLSEHHQENYFSFILS